MTFAEGFAPRGLFERMVALVPTGQPEGTYVARPGDKFYKPPAPIERAFFTNKNGVRVTYYKAQAQDEKMIILGSSGFKSDYLFTPEDVRKLNENGVSVLWFALPHLKDKNATGFLPYYLQAAEDILSDPKSSEIKRWCNKNVPKVFVGHSTGAQIFLRLMQNKDCAAKLRETFAGAAFSSPYLRPPRTVSRLNPLRYTFDWYSSKNRDFVPSETLLGRAYLSMCGRDNTPDPNKNYTEPSYGQIRELMTGGDSILADLRNRHSEIKMNMQGLPLAVFAGDGDGFSSTAVSKELAKTLGGGIYVSANGGHAPISESPETRSYFIESCRRMAHGTFNEFARDHGMTDYKAKARNDGYPPPVHVKEQDSLPDQAAALALPAPVRA